MESSKFYLLTNLSFFHLTQLSLNLSSWAVSLCLRSSCGRTSQTWFRTSTPADQGAAPSVLAHTGQVLSAVTFWFHQHPIGCSCYYPSQVRPGGQSSCPSAETTQLDEVGLGFYLTQYPQELFLPPVVPRNSGP